MHLLWNKVLKVKVIGDCGCELMLSFELSLLAMIHVRRYSINVPMCELPVCMIQMLEVF